MGEVNQLAGPAMDMLSARRVMDAPARVFPGGGRSAQPPGRVLHDSFIRQPPSSGPKDLVAQPALDPSGELGQAQMMGTSQGPNSIQPQPQAGMGMARMMGGQASQMGQYGQRGPMGQMGGFGMQQPSFARQFQPQFGGGGFFGGMYQSRPPQMFGGGGFGMNPYGLGMQGMGMGGMRGMGMGGMGGYGMSPMMNRGFRMGMGGMQNPYSMMGQQPMMRQAIKISQWDQIHISN